jgi:uncharacterized protein (DUF983 family)
MRPKHGVSTWSGRHDALTDPDRTRSVRAMPIEIDARPAPAPAPRDSWAAARRGWACRCPSCGEGRLFTAFLKVADRCAACGTELHHHRADDAPPYFTMFVVGHVVIGLLLAVEKRFQPDLWVHIALWVPATIVMSLWLLPRIKGALIGWQWALRMHGFGQSVVGVDTPEPWAGDTVPKRDGS